MLSSFQPPLTLTSCRVPYMLSSSCCLCLLVALSTALPSQSHHSSQGHHPSSFIAQSSTNTRCKKEIPLNFRIRSSCPKVPALSGLPLGSQSSTVSPSLLTPPLPLPPSCNIIWKFFICNLYPRRGSISLHIQKAYHTLCYTKEQSTRLTLSRRKS